LSPGGEVFVGAARLRELDDLTLLVLASDLHREATQGSALRERDPERTLQHAVERVLEGQLELGERERSVDDRPRAVTGPAQSSRCWPRQPSPRPRRVHLGSRRRQGAAGRAGPGWSRGGSLRRGCP
jgi:hypothetical protein